MTDQITYYAICDEGRGPDRLVVGVFRRVKSDSGQIDEVFSPHLKWESSPLLDSAERGDTMYDFIPITEDAAGQIIERMRERPDRRFRLTPSADRPPPDPGK